MENKDLGGRPQTSGLFKTFPDREDIPDAPYDLDVFKEIFFRHMEPSGYLCAMEAFNDIPKKKRWDEWKRLFHGNAALKRIHQEWCEELEIFLCAVATQELAEGCDPKDFSRLKYIKEGKLFDKGGAGRPSKGQPTRQERTKDSVKNKLPKNMTNKIIDLGKEWQGRSEAA